MPTRRILLLSDGRPGHFNLSEGIAAAIGRLGPIEIERTEVRRGRWSGATLAALTRLRLPAKLMLSRVYGIDDATLPAADIIVSAGAETLAASVWLARSRNAPNIFYGSLRWFDPHDFALVLTSYARNATRARHALALKPSRLDPATLPGRRQTCNTAAIRPATTAALLIGGDAGPITYTDRDWSNLLAAITAIGQADGTRWLIANSRRTPDMVGDALARLADEPATPITRYLDVRTAGPGTLSALLAAADAAICTADSSSMISECVWARLPTVALLPQTFSLTPDERSYRDWLASSGWCRELPLAELTLASLSAALASIKPMQDNPQQSLAELIDDRLRLA